jgi:drug/metabolite transporter (DMT)-like permease
MSNTKKALIYMHLSVVLWGITGVLGRSIQLSEGMLVGYRLLITAFTLGIHALLIEKLPLPGFQDMRKMVLIGFLITVHWLFFYGGIKYSNVSIALSMLASQALFTTFFEWIFVGKPISKRELTFGLVAMLGIWIIFYGERLYGVGIFLALMASLVGSLFNVFNKPIVEKHNPVMVSFVEISAGVVMLLFFLPVYVSFFNITYLVPTNTDWILLIILAFFCTHITLILSLKALKYLDAFTLNLSINLEPVYGIALAFFIFQEHKFLSARFFVGAALILLSVVLHAYFKSKNEKAVNQ